MTIHSIARQKKEEKTNIIASYGLSHQGLTVIPRGRSQTDKRQTTARQTAHVIKILYAYYSNLYSGESPSESEVMKESMYMDKACMTCALVIVDNSGRSSHTCVISGKLIRPWHCFRRKRRINYSEQPAARCPSQNQMLRRHFAMPDTILE